MMVAVEEGQLEVVQEFLKEGCEVNYQEKASDSLYINTATIIERTTMRMFQEM